MSAPASDSILSPTLSRRQLIGALLGPLFLVLTWVLEAPVGMNEAAWATAGIAALMATWWICETVPIPVTALLPLVWFPIRGLAKMESVASPYAHPIVFLFFGGFLLALAMERWGLHRRVAFGLIGILGLKPNRIIGGFLLTSALVSMWVSNTATALMMLPIAVSVASLVPLERRADPAMKTFTVALLLSVAYGATTGGMGTLIGTPPNALLAGFVSRNYGIEIGFAQWMALGVPVTLLALPIVYWVLTRGMGGEARHELPGARELIETERSSMGRISGPQLIVAIVFILTALAWVLRPILEKWIPGISDTGIALTAAVALFLIPAPGSKGEFILNWGVTRGMPWDVILLFGGGLSLAAQIQDSGLSTWLGEQALLIEGMPVILVVAVLSFGILMLTELTSNTATAATFLPVAAAVAISFGQNPLLLLVPTALAANCSYMMPVGTPPNAIVFGSGLVTLPQMVRAGLWLNVLLVPLIVGALWLLGPWVLGIQIDVLPDWVKTVIP